MHLDFLKHKDEILNHEKYVSDKAKEIKEETKATIDAQASALLLAETHAEQYETKIKEHEGKLTKLTTNYLDVASRVADLTKKVEALEAEVKTAQEDVGTIKQEEASSFRLGEEVVMDGSRQAWYQEMKGVDLECFRALISHQMVVIASQRLGVEPPEFHSDGDEEEVESPTNQDAQDGNLDAT